ncbi:MAG TPA: glycosyltransferase family 39 protein, partial [Acidimicrobiales bacterium]|nr:glycosyltransferase family 39 protein [Acidimicrobiales bacterium]
GESRRGSALAWWAVALLAAVGVALRVWLLASRVGTIDSDEAAGALIARELLDGHFSVFLWGNAYGGTLEAFPTAALFAVFGSGTVAAKGVMIGLYGVGAVLVWRVGRRTVGEAGARLAGVLFWVFPGAMVLISTKARLYYGSGLVLGLFVLLLCLRLDDRPERRDLALLGLVLGLAVWNNVQVGYLAVPAIAWLAVRRGRRLWRWAWLGAPGLVLGAAPWIAFNVRNGWPSLDEPGVPVASSYPERLEGFFTHVLPMALGVRRSYLGTWVLGPAGKIVYLALLAGFAWLLVRRRIPSLLAVVALAYPFVFAVPRSSFYVGEPRYALVLAPVLCLLLALGVTRMVSGRSPQLVAAGVAVAASVAVLGPIVEFEAPAYDLNPPRLGPLVSALDRLGVRAAYADYWLAYRLTFETGERIVATPVAFVRHRPLDEEVRRAGASTFLLYRGSPEDARFRTALTQRGVPFERVPVSAFVIYSLGQPGADLRGLVGGA